MEKPRAWAPHGCRKGFWLLAVVAWLAIGSGKRLAWVKLMDEFERLGGLGRVLGDCCPAVIC